jgi:D-alanyl-D-alanine carboxypeptidase (penicillin-binding protein 5/6)
MSRASLLARMTWLLVALLASPAGAQTAAVPAPPPKLTFKSHYLVDFSTDRVLAASAPDVPLPPASLTKLMTAYVVFGALESGRAHLDDRARISEKAWRMGGTRMFVEVNSEVTVEDLVRGMLIQSGNDASVALAEHLAGSVDAFVTEMNAAAETLGMRSTVFRNPHGLPARGHVSTARDLTLLARAIIHEFPEFYGLYAEREFAYNGIAQQNRNALLWRDPSVDGMKTGYTEAAGYCLVISAERDGMRLIAVVLGAQTARSRNDGAQKLLEYGFANFETRKLYSAGQELDAARVRARRLLVRGGRRCDDPARRRGRARREHGCHRAAVRTARARHRGRRGEGLVRRRTARGEPADRAGQRHGRRGVGTHARRAVLPVGMTGASESLLQFPCDLPIKVFGRNDAGFRAAALAIVKRHYGAAYKVVEQQSKQGAYLSLTITVRAETRAQIDAVYQDLVADERVLMAF